MQAFTLPLKDGGLMCGFSFLPKPPSDNRRLPLIVGIHGGSYAADYFDCDQEHSVATLAELFSIPFVSINRPGYQKSTHVPPPLSTSSWIQAQGSYISNVVLPAVWAYFAPPSKATSIVLLTHSVGSAVGIVASSIDGSFPLSGLILSGIGTVYRPINVEFKDGQPEALALMPPEIKDEIWCGASKGLTSPEVLSHTHRLNNPVPVEESIDIRTLWPEYCLQYMAKISVPVMYAMAVEDALFASDRKAVHAFASNFISAPKLDVIMISGAPHCVELSNQSRSWLLRCIGFALECSLAFA